MSEPAVEGSKPRSRKLYVLWAIALTLLIPTALFCWLVVVPYANAYAVIGHRLQADSQYAEFGVVDLEEDVAQGMIAELGGKSEAAYALRIYLCWPHDSEFGTYTAEALLGHCGRAGVEVLLSRVRDDEGYRRPAIAAMGTAGSEAGEAVPVLVDALREQDPDVQSAALWTLGEIGPGAAAALPEIKRLANGDGGRIDQAAVEALKAIKGEHDAPRDVFANAKTFGFGVKLGQRPSARKTDVAFAALLSGPDAKEQFSAVFKLKSVYARLYALCALRHLDKKLCGKLSAEMDKARIVNTRNGCVRDEATVGKIIKEIESGRYDHIVKDIEERKAADKG